MLASHWHFAHLNATALRSNCAVKPQASYNEWFRIKKFNASRFEKYCPSVYFEIRNQVYLEIAGPPGPIRRFRSTLWGASHR